MRFVFFLRTAGLFLAFVLVFFVALGLRGLFWVGFFTRFRFTELFNFLREEAAPPLLELFLVAFFVDFFLAFFLPDFFAGRLVDFFAGRLDAFVAVRRVTLFLVAFGFVRLADVVVFLRVVVDFRFEAPFRAGLRVLDLPLDGVLFLPAAALLTVFRFFAAMDRRDDAGLMVRDEDDFLAPIVRDTDIVRLLLRRASF